MYYYDDGTNKKRVHNYCLPINFRMLIVGPSGCGKTTLLMRFLLEKGLLNYDKLYVFSKSLYQPEYQCLIEGFKNKLPKDEIAEIINNAEYVSKKSSIKEIALGMGVLRERNKLPPCEIEAEFSNNPAEIPDPTELDGSVRNLIVFDDIMMDRKQTTAESYFTQSRAKNCDCIYLSQNFTKLPLHSVRSNANFLVFFKSGNLVVRQLHRNFCSTDIPYKEFEKLCSGTWSKKHSFIAFHRSIEEDYDDNNKNPDNSYSDEFKDFLKNNRIRDTLELRF